MSGKPLHRAFHVAAALALLVGACAGSRSRAPKPLPPASEMETTNPTAAQAMPEPGAPPMALLKSTATEVSLSPKELDPAVSKYPAPEFAYFDPKATPQAHLVVYLVGANNKPERGRTMGQFLAGLGFRVVVPGYANDYDIRALCMPAGTPDPDCHGKLRLEALEGIDHSPHIAITPPDSLESRIVQMLRGLAKSAPAMGWDKYLAGDKPRWEEIIVAGHSHGASSSGLIGKVRKVHRVVMLSGPFDNRAGEPAAWTKLPPATPPDRVFGFSHMKEEQYAGHIKDWAAMGLPAFGPLVVVETAAPPFSGSHQLVTSLPPANGGNPHGTTAAGKAAPLAPDGHYVYEAAWRYLFGI
jgi:hypothetical protein